MFAAKPASSIVPVVVAPALAVALLLAACGGSSRPATTPGASPTTHRPPPPTECIRDLAAEAPNSTVLGAETGDYLADRFSLTAGDFNGDGQDDILIGAPLADGPDNARANAGEAYVILGSSTLPATLDLASAEPALTVYGESAGDNMGFTVTAGDVNGDGADDAVIGSRFASGGGRVAAGKVYVVFGKSDFGGTIDTAAGDQDATVIGIDPGDFFGISLGNGDVNGDGTDDLLVGAAGGDGPDGRRTDAGEAYVVLGRDDWPETIDLAREAPHLTVFGAAGGDSLANYIAAGDTDGNDREEMVLGVPFADGPQGQEDSGRAYIVPVGDDGGSLDLASGSGFGMVTGAATRDALGFYVAAADVNGDERDDLIAGARDADGPDDTRTNSGEVHVIFGRPDLPNLDLGAAPPDLTIYGRDSGDSLGFSIAAGDVNGDSIADILAGAPIADSCDNARADGGEVNVVFGSKDPPAQVDLASEAADLSFYGEEAGDEAGFSLTAADVNGDGRADVVLGALLADGPGNSREDAGEAYVIVTEE